MPKPILSDSLFNADDVATAILSEANLQVTNENLGVTDISTSISGASGVSQFFRQAYAFNGFVFFSVEYAHLSSTPSDGETLSTITNSDYYPIAVTVAPCIGYQGDQAQYIRAETNGIIKVNNPINSGSNDWRVAVNMFWRYT